jgi:WD40 repeat protein
MRYQDPIPLAKGLCPVVLLGAVFSPDGNRIATASYDRTLKLRHAQTGKDQRTLAGHGAQVIRVAFRPNGQCLASASADGTVRLWDAGSTRR